MNLAEKLAATYLRLNGFLPIPHFTAFDGNQHIHIDIVALRSACSQEVVRNVTLLTDDLLFQHISSLMNCPSRETTIGLIAEVRTNSDRDQPSEGHLRYVAGFLGHVPIAKLAFYEGTHEIQINGDAIDIGMRYAGLWVQHRIDWMLEKENEIKLQKTGSWNWSESFLSDFLTLRRYDLLKKNIPE